MRYYRLLLIIVVVFLTACSAESGFSSPTEALQHTSIAYTDVLGVDEVDQEAAIFYEADESNIGAGIARKLETGWKWVFGGGYANPESEETVSVGYINVDQLPVEGDGTVLYWGIIKDQRIVKLTVKYRNGQEIPGDVHIVSTNKHFSMWSLISDYYFGSMPGLEIKGYDQSGNEIYSNAS